jgi:hypothetical protein
MTKSALLARLGGIAAIFLLALIVYLPIIRPWQLRWRATDEEVARDLPGDELVASPDFDATRAVTVRATPEEIWPWIVQIGDRRAGFYSYDWFDNRGKPSADRIIPELQQLEVGDPVPIAPGIHEVVHSLDPPRSMVWVGSEVPPFSTWAWYLEPLDETHTRLLTRLRYSYHWTSPILLFELWLDWGDFPFMRRCMLGIKQRAEGENTHTYAGAVAEGAQWAIAFLIFSAAAVSIMLRSPAWRPWVVALATGPVFGLIFFGGPPLWLGTLLELALLIGLVWSYRTTAGIRSKSNIQAS